PRIVDALKSDLKNVKAIDRCFSAVYRGQQPDTIYRTIAQHVLEETDYLKEAQHQEMFRKLFSSRGDIDIPEVIHDYTSARVLTTSFRVGSNFEDFCSKASQELRDKAGQTLWNFYYRSVFEHGVFNADPHPGNFIFKAEQVTFLDFGRVQYFSAGFVEKWKLLLRATLERDRQAMVASVVAMNSIKEQEIFDYDYMLRTILVYHRPWLSDEPFVFTPDYMRRLWRLFLPDNPNKSRINYSSDMAFLDQMFFGVNALLTRLGARVDCRATMLDLLYEDSKAAPAPFSPTELATLSG
ncbi:MAG: AarF/UbiB family protein, partial [Myxococcota bacterium]